MPEHFTKNTVEASFWCNKCRKATMHRVDNGRRGPCIYCMKELEVSAHRVKLPPAAVQGEMF